MDTCLCRWAPSISSAIQDSVDPSANRPLTLPMMPGLRHTGLLMFFWLLLAVGAYAQPNEGTSPTLAISAMDFDGAPLAKVAFAVTLEKGGTESARTNESGQAFVLLNAIDEIVVVALRDERYQSVEDEQFSSAENRALFFKLFHSDVSEMSSRERHEFARVLPAILTRDAEENHNSQSDDEALPRPVPTPLRFVAFLNDYRREIRGELETGSFASEGDAVVSARVVDERGQPVLDQLVHLYMYDESAEKLRLVGYERTDSGGVAVFDHLAPNRFYRAEAVGTADRIARSTIRLADPGKPTVFPPMVLRSSGEFVSGFVFLDQEPAPGTMVTAVPFLGGPTLRTTTDAVGYFSLAPLPGGNVELVFERSAHPQSLRGSLQLAERGGELFVPLALLAGSSSE